MTATLSRRRLTLADQVTILARQAKCPKCGQPLGNVKGIDWHHPNELAISKDDSVENRSGMHKDCHAVVTNGTKATSAGSSKHKVAKVRRLVKKGVRHGQKMAAKEVLDPEVIGNSKHREHQEKMRRKAGL